MSLNTELASTIKPATKGLHRLAGVKVLIVDDSVDNRYLLEFMLKHEGAQYEEARNGEEAVAKALIGDFDIVLMDIQMPGMDGYEALAYLKKSGYDKPAIALTAHAMLEERLRTRAAGFVSHLTKPIDRQTLISEIITHTQI